jgi:hypothetical protein
LSVDWPFSVQNPEKVDFAVSGALVEDGNFARALPEQLKTVLFAVLYQGTQIASQGHTI